MTAHRRRPLIRWHGGKWKIAKWILEHFPSHLTYVEPFGGGASVLLQKAIAPAECYNDLDDTLFQLFELLQDPEMAEALVQKLEMTPYSRREFEKGYQPVDGDPVETARRTICRSFMGYGSDGTAGDYKTGFRRAVTSTNKFPAREWVTYPAALRITIERLRGVVLEHKDAFDLIPELDSPETLFYCDPPYMPETRSQGNRRRGAGFHVYRHELDAAQHLRLLEMLVDLKGMVVLSGYPHELYDLLPGWQTVTRQAFADGGRARVEKLWINPAAQERIRADRAATDRQMAFLGE